MNYEYLKKIIINSNPDIASAYSVSKTLGHDPFKGHGPDDDTGKSRFSVTSNNDYVGDYEGPCNADDGKPAEVRPELVEIVRDDDSVKLFVYRLVPTFMVEETFGGNGFLRPPTDEEIKAGVECGVTTSTRRPELGHLKVANVHELPAARVRRRRGHPRGGGDDGVYRMPHQGGRRMGFGQRLSWSSRW